MESKLTIAVIGAGLVGSLSSCMFGKRGHHVDVYEYREDIRKTDLVMGKSINLSLSARGQRALRIIGLEDSILNKHAIPMKGRMIHTRSGELHSIPYDPLTNKCIYSVGRKFLNEILITAGEKHQNVKFHFQHKLIHLDLTTNTMQFKIESSGKVATAVADLIIGADGAFSAVRREMMKQSQFQFSQTYIEHCYIELCILPTSENEFAMPANHLHIWPRSTFMMIALPNQDRTWTVSLFMPIKQFEKIDSPTKLLEFFEKYFPDSIPLIGKDKLINDYFSTKFSHLVSIKCNPYNNKGKCLIIGDAAHAMVPFFGQGMNAGFEDCLILDELCTQFGSNTQLILEEFSKRRCEDAAAICDLAMYNYIEMRDLVNKRSFLLRKKLDTFLYWVMPNVWIPLYNSVTFSNMKYSDCLKNRKWQDEMIKRIIVIILGLGLSMIIGMVTKFFYLD